MVNINIQKKDLWLLSAIMVFLVGVVVVVAYNSGATPDVMGHSDEELEIGLDCTTVTCSASPLSCTATCSSGYTVTGGGGNPNTNGDLIFSYTSGNGWVCLVSNGGTCYARCCRLD